MGNIRSNYGRSRARKPQVTALAMPMFAHRSPPDIAGALTWVRERFPDCPPIGALEGSDDTFTASIPGGQIGMAFVSAPVTSGDLEGPTALAWHWPSASATVAAHVAHEICFANSPELDFIALRLLHSRVIAGIAAVGSATAVYVGSSRLVREGQAYIAHIEQASRENLPLLSWLGFNPAEEESGRSAYTSGLGEFGLLELEIRNSALQWPDLFEFLANVAHYELATNVQIGDGETIGGSESERIVVRHLRSRFIPDTTVARIALPSVVGRFSPLRVCHRVSV